MPFRVIQPPSDQSQFTEEGKRLYAAAKALGIELDAEGFLYSWVEGVRVVVEETGDEIKGFVASADASLAEFTGPLKAAVENLDALTAWVIAQAKANPNEIGAASVEYLHVFGYTAYAYMWALMARAALGKEGQDDFYASKLGTARFFFARLLPRIHSLTASVKAGSESLYLLDAAQF